MKNFLKLPVLLLVIFLMSSFQSVETKSNYKLKKWVKLGTLKVSKGADHDVLPVNIRKGKFRKLKIIVSHSPVFIHNIKVVYGNGTVENIRINKKFKPSDALVIDLKGNKRFINKIIFNYHTHFKVLGKGRIKVYGKR